MNNIDLVLDCICLFDNFFLTNELTKSMIFPFPVKKIPTEERLVILRMKAHENQLLVCFVREFSAVAKHVKMFQPKGSGCQS